MTQQVSLQFMLECKSPSHPYKHLFYVPWIFGVINMLSLLHAQIREADISRLSFAVELAEEFYGRYALLRLNNIFFFGYIWHYNNFRIHFAAPTDLFYVFVCDEQSEGNSQTISIFSHVVYVISSFAMHIIGWTMDVAGARCCL